MSVIEAAVALCAVGAEKIVSNEIRKLGLKVSEGGFGRVRFQGTGGQRGYNIVKISHRGAGAQRVARN